MSSLKVCEIFGSIDGEGLFTGNLATFIRLGGCNLRCKYCDTKYSFETSQMKSMTISEIIAEVNRIGYHRVTLTGGEPLISDGVLELVSSLIENGNHVNIETNGSVRIDSLLASDSVTVTMDYKLPSSGVNESSFASRLFREDEIKKLMDKDVLKLVVGKGDFAAAEEILVKTNPRSYVYLSPVFGEIEPVELVEFAKMMSSKYRGLRFTQRMRVQVQLHKIIWKPEERGV